MPEKIEIGGWEGRPNKHGGYDIHDARGEYRGWSPESMIREVLTEDSGEKYRNLPEVKRDQIRRETSATCRGFAGQWHRQTRYFVGEKALGFIQTRRVNICKGNNRIESMTSFENSCVIGSDLAWLCKMNGLRLAD